MPDFVLLPVTICEFFRPLFFAQPNARAVEQDYPPLQRTVPVVFLLFVRKTQIYTVSYHLLLWETQMCPVPQYQHFLQWRVAL